MEGKTALGASSPANPALTRPEPLSHTRAVVSSSSHILMDSNEGHNMAILTTRCGELLNNSYNLICTFSYVLLTPH